MTTIQLIIMPTAIREQNLIISKSFVLNANFPRTFPSYIIRDSLEHLHERVRVVLQPLPVYCVYANLQLFRWCRGVCASQSSCARVCLNCTNTGDGEEHVQ